MFPPGAGFPVTGPTPGSTALDGPPPSPTPMSSAPSGVDPGAPFSMKGIAGGGGMPGQVSTDALPPEVKTGVIQSASAMNDLLTSYLQVMPDQTPVLTMMINLLQQFTANVTQAGGGPVSPTATGPAFPGGGMDRGIAGPGSV